MNCHQKDPWKIIKMSQILNELGKKNEIPVKILSLNNWELILI